MQKYSRLTGSQSEKFTRQKKFRKTVVIGLVFISLVTWTSIMSGLSHLGIFTIQNIRILGADNDIADSIKAAAQKSLEGNYLHLFSRANTLLYSSAAMKAAVLDSSSRIQEVLVKHDGLNSVLVMVTEKTPAALICNNLPNWTGSNLTFDSDTCSFADADGVAYKTAPNIVSHMYNRYYMADTDDASATSSTIDSDTFKALQSFYSGVAAHGIQVEGMLIKGGGEYELYVENLPTSAAGSKEATTSTAVVYANDRNNLANELVNLITFLDHGKKDAPQYDSIDVRYGSNVFYRLASQ